MMVMVRRNERRKEDEAESTVFNNAHGARNLNVALVVPSLV